MAFKSDFNLFVGAKFGVFKAIKVTPNQPTINKNIQSLQHLNKAADITTLAWSDENEEEILLGLSNQVVKVYDTNYKAFNSSTDVGFSSSVTGDSKGSICGLSRFDGALVTAVESGHIRLWRYENDKALEIYAGGPISRMRHSVLNPQIIGTGGLENELKLWDLTTGKNTFTAKNVPPDSLQLRVKVWVSDLGFFSESDKVVVGSRYGYVRLYDPKAQRRPVMKVNLPDKSVSCLASRSSDQTVLCGLAKGNIQAIDLRMGRCAQKYSGFLGAVRDVACHPTEPFVVSVSLDRYIRIHHLVTKEILYKEYSVSRMNCLLMRSNFTFKDSVKEHENSGDTSESIPKEFANVLDEMEEVVDTGRQAVKKRCTGNFIDNPISSKKKKTSAFMNPFAVVGQCAHNKSPSKTGAIDQADGTDSDDDIQILSETVGSVSSGCESDPDEAEGSSSDLGSDDSDKLSEPPESSESSKSSKENKCQLLRKRARACNPFYETNT